MVQRLSAEPTEHRRIWAYSDEDTIYLAQIRDGIVCPYISEIVPVTAADQQSAVYTAAVWGYNYYISGDIDTSADTYTLLACKRTADPSQAITNISAVSSAVILRLEETQSLDMPADEPAESSITEAASPTEAEAAEESSEVSTSEAEPQEASAPETEEDALSGADDASALPDAVTAVTEQQDTASSEADEETVLTETAEAGTEPQDDEASETSAASAETEQNETPLTGAAIGISGIGYTRASRTEIPGDQPYYLYATKDPAAGNPVSMLYVGEMAENSDIMCGTWLSGFFGTKGATSAYGFP